MEQQEQSKIILHACCGICSGYPINLLKEHGYTPVVYFYNPNINSKEEFDRRLDAQRTICQHHLVDLVVEPYHHSEFTDKVRGLENEPERGARCDKCIELRLYKTAEMANKLGISKFTTSLVISPHKNFAKISQIGHACADKFTEVQYLAIDFKKKDGFLQTNQLSKKLNLYRQNYCGCEFSKPL